MSRILTFLLEKTVFCLRHRRAVGRSEVFWRKCLFLSVPTVHWAKRWAAISPRRSWEEDQLQTSVRKPPRCQNIWLNEAFLCTSWNTLLYSSLFKHTHRTWDFLLIPKSLLCYTDEIICVLSQAAVIATVTCSGARRQMLWGRGLSLSLSACMWVPTFGWKKKKRNRLGWKKVQTGCSALVANEVALLFWWMWELVRELVNLMSPSVYSLRLFVCSYEAISWLVVWIWVF